MDVLSPDLMWIGKRCYRLPVLDSRFSDENKEEAGSWDESEPNNVPLCTEEPCDIDEYDFETTNSDRIKMQFSVSRTYWPVIIGKGAVTKKRIEKDFKVVIFVPKPNQLGKLTITGSSKRDLVLARRNIDAIILSFRHKLPFTHFVSIPVISDQIKSNFTLFQEQVLKMYGYCRGIHETIFKNPSKLHLTLGCLVLTDEVEREEAKQLLTKLAETHLRPLIASHKPLILEVRGIEYMNDDPSDVDVLYATVKTSKDNSVLQDLADMVVQALHDAGHQQRCRSEDTSGTRVKLHVTLMNSKFRGEKQDDEAVDDRESNQRWKKKETFDAAAIMKEFGNFYFGKLELHSLELSVRHATSANTGYYQSSLTLPL